MSAIRRKALIDQMNGPEANDVPLGDPTAPPPSPMPPPSAPGPVADDPGPPPMLPGPMSTDPAGPPPIAPAPTVDDPGPPPSMPLPPMPEPGPPPMMPLGPIEEPGGPVSQPGPVVDSRNALLSQMQGPMPSAVDGGEPASPDLPPGTPTTGNPSPGPTGPAPTTPPAPGPTDPTAGPVGAPLPGWDPNKWNDQTHTTAKYVIGRILSKYPHTPEGLQQAKAEIEATGLARLVGDDTLQLLQGEGAGHTVDVMQGAKQGGQAWQWMDLQGGGAAGAGAAGPGQGSGQGGPTDPLQQALREQLLKLMQGGNSPVDMNDPAVAAQSNAYRNSRERSARQERETMAERAAFTGLNSGGQGSGAFDSSLQGIAEQSGQDIAGNDARLMGTEVAAKRQQLSQALDLANAIGARQEAAQLSRDLADLDNQYRYAALQQNQGQYEDSAAFNWADFIARQNRQNTLDLMPD